MGARAGSIGALARSAGVKVETVRYYERIGLLPAPARTASRYRTYATEDAKRLIFIRRARELGFTLEEISTLLALSEGGERTCADVQQVASAHLKLVRAKLKDLRMIERTLTESIRKCETEGRVSCPLIEALSG